MSPKNLSETINPYAELLVGLDKTVYHSVAILPHPVGQIKQALFQSATQVYEDKQLEDLGMVAQLALFLTDTEMSKPTIHTPKFEYPAGQIAEYLSSS